MEEEEPYPRPVQVKINTAMKAISLEVPQKIKLFTSEHTYTQRTTDPIIDICNPCLLMLYKKGNGTAKMSTIN